jgi:hypothetical protein
MPMAAPHSLVHVEVLLTREEALSGLLAMQMIISAGMKRHKQKKIGPEGPTKFQMCG